MANTIAGNKIFLDSDSSDGFVTAARTKVAYIIFSPVADHDQIILRETETGADCIKIVAGAGDHRQTLPVDLSNIPLVFNNGIWVDTLSSGAVATLITTSTGG